METTTTIESRVASAILERPTGSIEIDGKTYDIAPPTVATLILVSEIVSTLPIVEKTDDNEKKTYSVLHHARNFKALGDIAAALILGAKAIKEERQRENKPRRWWQIFSRRKPSTPTSKELAQKILDNVRPSVLFECIIQRLKDNEVGIFFLITTSLAEANLLAPTKEVAKE